MIRIKGLLFKTLLLVIVVAIVSLASSYGFVTAQQAVRFEENIQIIKHSHLQATQLFYQQQLQKQKQTAEELFTLTNIASLSPEQAAKYVADIWPKMHSSYGFSSMSIANFEQSFEFGDVPQQEIAGLQQESYLRSKAETAIICHTVCELASSIPIQLDNSKWALTLTSNITSSTGFLSKILGSEIKILVSDDRLMREQISLTSYLAENRTELEEIEEMLLQTRTKDELKTIKSLGLKQSFNEREYYIWTASIESFGSELEVLFVRDMTAMLSQQNQQKEQIIIIFMTVTLGILLTLITFSIIPISQINKLRRAIKLIANKEYSMARYRLGSPQSSKFNDELYDLENEFRNAIDMLESYEHELDLSQKKLLRQATIDSITGLFTRNVLMDDLLKSRTKNTYSKVAIFFLDLDGFKPVNDNLGHEAGNIMLKKIGYRLKGLSNKFIKVYRIGGDEFVICFNNYNSEDSLLQMAESIVQLFAAPFRIYETNISISASIGIALQETKDLNADQLLRYADIAMYQAKEDGKNRYKFFDKSMRAKTQLRFTIKNDFLISLANEQLFLVFQPIVKSDTRKVTKLEALCRWKHPELGFISPLTFIDVLEESENMNTLFAWIVTRVVDEVIYLDTVGLQDIVISVNLSPSQLVDERALELLNSQLKTKHIPPQRIELEITETTLITNFAQAKAWIEKASQIGFRVAIDDFGAGYSSLSYLAAFNYNTVKLDRSLLDKIDADTRQQRIVGSLTQMIHSLSIPIVAEGAETEGQFEQLRKLGCDYIQGYYISKPITHEKLVTFLKENKEI